MVRLGIATVVAMALPMVAMAQPPQPGSPEEQAIMARDQMVAAKAGADLAWENIPQGYSVMGERTTAFNKMAAAWPTLNQNDRNYCTGLFTAGDADIVSGHDRYTLAMADRQFAFDAHAEADALKAQGDQAGADQWYNTAKGLYSSAEVHFITSNGHYASAGVLQFGTINWFLWAW